MLNLNKKRAALLAGLSFVVLSGATTSHASTANWGSIQAPAAINAPEPAKKPKKERAAKRKPSTASPADTGREATIEVAVAPPLTPAPFRAVSDEPKVKKAKTPRQDRKDKKSAKAEASEPVIPSGPLHFIVSIDAQRGSLYANGALVATTKVSTGTKTHPTPLGVFAVIQKNRHHISNLYGAPMPYMQRLSWSGTALHTGALPGYPASHGCIRLPNEFAQLLWKATKLGARVIVTRDEVKPVEIAHARLLLPAAPPVAQPQAAPGETTGSPIRTADATGSLAMTETTPPSDTVTTIIRDPLIDRPARAKTAAERKPGPVSIFISRKDGRLYVRQALQPLFDIPLKLRDPAQPLGTHVYTAMDMKDGEMRWTSVSVPSAFPRAIAKIEKTSKGKKVSRTDAPMVSELPAPSAAEALDRIELPQEALDRLAGLVIPGSSLIVSDNPLSSETGKYTDFIVLTR